MLEYNEQTENLMEIAMMLEQLKGESEYLFEVLTDIDSITWKQKFVDWANEFTETYEPNKDVWPGNYLEVIEGFAREKILEFAGVEEDKAEEERGFRYFEIWDENGQSAKFYIVEQYLELSQSMMEAIAESLAKGAGK
ncbi:MAG: hypothetical protein ACLRHX_13470 [Mediterraneibacter gnavus]